MSERFWAVWRMNGGGAPNKRHATREAAVAEAGRLSAQAGEPYFVLESIGIVQPVRSPLEFVRHDGSVERLLYSHPSNSF